MRRVQVASTDLLESRRPYHGGRTNECHVSTACPGSALLAGAKRVGSICRHALARQDDDLETVFAGRVLLHGLCVRWPCRHCALALGLQHYAAVPQQVMFPAHHPC